MAAKASAAVLESVLALVLWYDDHKTANAVLYSHYSAALQHRQTR
jgi:hypothetical protein